MPGLAKRVINHCPATDHDERTGKCYKGGNLNEKQAVPECSLQPHRQLCRPASARTYMPPLPFTYWTVSSYIHAQFSNVSHGESYPSQASPQMTIQRMGQPQEAVQP